MNLVDGVVQLLQGVEGLAQVIPNAAELPNQSPAAMVDLKVMREDEPEEMGPDQPAIYNIVGVVLAVKYGHDNEASAARDTLVGLVRAAWAVLRQDPTLGGACLSSRVRPAEFGYHKMGGGNWAGAVLLIHCLEE